MNSLTLVHFFAFPDRHNMIFHVSKTQEAFLGGALDINGRSSSTVRCSLVILMPKRAKNS